MGLSSESRRGDLTSLSQADDMLAVCRAALRVECDVQEAAEWYLHTCIAELDNLTPVQLVACGRADEMMRFLEAVHSGSRG